METPGYERLTAHRLGRLGMNGQNGQSAFTAGKATQGPPAPAQHGWLRTARRYREREASMAMARQAR